MFTKVISTESREEFYTLIHHLDKVGYRAASSDRLTSVSLIAFYDKKLDHKMYLYLDHPYVCLDDGYHAKKYNLKTTTFKKFMAKVNSPDNPAITPKPVPNLNPKVVEILKAYYEKTAH